jgi:uncharacterized protein YndB with AHSA1/START domain
MSETTSGSTDKDPTTPGAASGSTVTFRLSATTDGRTQVELDHEGFEDSDEVVKTCNTLWGILMGHLKAYAETSTRFPALR